MTVYATRADLAHFGLTPQALANFTEAQQQAALEAASATADGYLRSRYSLPLSTWELDLRRNVCMLAAYDLMTMVGFPPEGDNETIVDRATKAEAWLKGVSAGVITPNVTESPPMVMSPAVATGRPRGW